MISRKQFIRRIAAGAAAPVLAPFLLSGCAPSGLTVTTRSTGGAVTVPAESLPPADDPFAFTRLYIDDEPNPVYLFRNAGSLAAVSSTCSHSGCAVRKLRDRFECPCHGSEYALNGSVLEGPASDPLRVFHVEERGEKLHLLLGEK